MARPLRIANTSGFYGDRAGAFESMVDGDQVDVITGDYLAELTTMILYKDRRRDSEGGYARSFLSQIESRVGVCLERQTKIVVNAGGLNPAALAQATSALLDRLGLRGTVAYLDGDDILDRLPALQAEGHRFEHLDLGAPLSEAPGPAVSANAYLGGWGIAEALRRGADIVICPRVTDASLAIGPAAWWHEWGREDWDRLAGATVAGHLIECGPQVTGGIYSDIATAAAAGVPGFPIAEIDEDGSCLITKQANMGGLVTVGTVTAQLLYEIASPHYLGPDVITALDSVTVEEAGRDRVRITGARGFPPTGDLKVSINCRGGYRNTMTLVLTGLDLEEKATWSEELVLAQLGGRDQFDEFEAQLVRFDHPNASQRARASAHLRFTAKSMDRELVDRRFSAAVVSLVTGGPAGCFTSAPARSSEFGVLWPALLRADAVEQRVHMPEGDPIVIPPPACHPAPALSETGEASGAGGAGETISIPLGRIAGARSGDKGPNLNLAVWVEDEEAYAWLRRELRPERIRQLLPEAADLPISRYDFPNVRGLNFVIKSFLGFGVSANTNVDAQGKSVGEFVRSRRVAVPIALARRLGVTEEESS